MRNYLFFLYHEIRTLIISPYTYIAAVLFLLLMGLFYILTLEHFTQAPQEGIPSTEFFKTYWLPVFFIVPLLTMKSFAEERRLGTLEALLSTPTSAFAITTIKFLSSYLFYLSIWSLTLLFPLVIKWLFPALSLDPHSQLFSAPALIGSFSFIAITGLLYIALGIFSSSLTRSQLVAGITCFSLLFLFTLGARLIFELPFFNTFLLEPLEAPLEYIQTFNYLEDFSRGILGSRRRIFSLTSTILLLGTTALVIEAKS